MYSNSNILQGWKGTKIENSSKITLYIWAWISGNRSARHINHAKVNPRLLMLLRFVPRRRRTDATLEINGRPETGRLC